MGKVGGAFCGLMNANGDGDFYVVAVIWFGANISVLPIGGSATGGGGGVGGGAAGGIGLGSGIRKALAGGSS